MAVTVDIPCTLDLKSLTDNPNERHARAVMLVGVGGIGARVAAPVLKLLRKNDSLILIDGDVVEERNLIRQHFTGSDVGLPKAEAVGRRLLAEARRIEASVHVVPEMVTPTRYSAINSRRFNNNVAYTIIISTVDSREARKMIADYMMPNHSGYVAWIDCGNSTRSGQVLLSLQNWPVTRYYAPSEGWVSFEGAQYLVTAPTLRELQPDLIDPTLDKVDTTEGCAVRFDTQTVGANQMAATIAINMASWLLDELPISSLGARFSLDGPSVVSYPIWSVKGAAYSGLRASALPPAKKEAAA